MMIKIDANEFMKTHTVRKRISILEPFRDEILKLKHAGYSIRQIMEFLELNNVTISQNALNSFIKTRQKSELKKAEKDSSSDLKTDCSSGLKRENLTAELGNIQTNLSAPSEKKRELVETNGRVIDVNYKPNWVDDDINLKDLL